MTIHYSADNDRTDCGKWAGLVYEFTADKGSVTCSACLDGRPSPRPLPDPNVTGPCEVQASPFCEPAAGQQRMNPMDQLNPDRSFRRYVPICQPCHDYLADAYVIEVHTNPAHAHLFNIERKSS